MDTKVIILDEKNFDMDKIKEIGSEIREGKLVVIPTETVYGLGANALDESAVEKIFIAKGRPQDNPLIVHIGDFEDLYKLVEEVPAVARKAMEMFWPGPITFILKKKDIIPFKTSGGLDSVGVRFPSNKIAQEIIRASMVPVAAPSANLSGKPSPTEVERCIEDLNGKVEYIIGGNESEIGLESTVLDCTVYPPCILRPGAITLEDLRKVDDKIYMDSALLQNNEVNKPKAPGMKYRHYAPKGELIVIKGKLENTINKINELKDKYIRIQKNVAILATDETISKYNHKNVISVGSRSDINTIGKNLFEALRKCDDLKVDIILSEAFDEIGVGIAIMNRLNKAAGYNIIEV